MNKPQAMSSLCRAFPEIDARAAESAAALFADAHGAQIDIYDLACFLAVLQDNKDARLRAAFFMIENFLVHGAPELRDWVDQVIEALQNVCAWRRQSTCVFSDALGQKTHALWEHLESIRRASSDLDLSDCSVLEAEILTWRLLREKIRALSAVA
jgi:hypothetical protein